MGNPIKTWNRTKSSYFLPHEKIRVLHLSLVLLTEFQSGLVLMHRYTHVCLAYLWMASNLVLLFFNTGVVCWHRVWSSLFECVNQRETSWFTTDSSVDPVTSHYGCSLGLIFAIVIPELRWPVYIKLQNRCIIMSTPCAVIMKWVRW